MKSKGKRNCRKKARYYSETRARIIGHIQAAKKEITLWPYSCPECGRWHLTRKKNNARPITAESSGIFA